MKALISIVVIVVMFMAARNIVQRWNETERKQRGEQSPQKVVAVVQVLPGLPDRMEGPLQDAIRQGPTAVRAFLDKYSSHIQDPRLGDIELDYAVSISRANLPEARQVYQAVKARTPANSPLAARLQKLKPTYE